MLGFFLRSFEVIAKRIESQFIEGDTGCVGYSRGFIERYGWFITIDALANSQVAKIEAIGNLSVREFIGYAAYYNNKQNEESRIMKQQQRLAMQR